MLQLNLLGMPEITIKTPSTLRFRTRKAEALLVYLAVTEERWSRDALSTLFWPGTTSSRARKNLRDILPTLRKQLSDYILFEGDFIWMNLSSHYRCDVSHFCTVLEQPWSKVETSILADTLALYRGSFLDGYQSSGISADFELWVTQERGRYHQLALAGLSELCLRQQAVADYESSLTTNQQLLKLAPWDEAAHRQQMALLAQSGQQSAALAHFERCRQLLANELDVEPEPATVELFEQIKATQTPYSPLSVPLKVESADWGDAPDLSHFYGREEEQEQLRHWLLAEQRRAIAILGMGGMGKTALASRVTRSVADNFDFVLWRSLINSPPLSEIVYAAIELLEPQVLPDLLGSIDEQLNLLFGHLRQRRCLLILDNMESIMQEDQAGAFRLGYETYARFLQRFGDTNHQSCLLITSREAPQYLGQTAPDTHAVGKLALTGLSDDAGQALLSAFSLPMELSAVIPLIQRYSGNPLALKLVATTIRDYFGGDPTLFLEDEPLIFDNIRGLLEAQMGRLSTLEAELLAWLAIEREAVPLSVLQDNLAHQHKTREVLKSTRALENRSLIQNNNGHFSLQNVVMEFATERLIDGVVAELIHWMLKNDEMDSPEGANHTTSTSWSDSDFNRFALMKAEAKDYVRMSQSRMLLEPVANQIRRTWNAALPTSPNAVDRVQALLQALRQTTGSSGGYAAANLLHLCYELKISVRGIDFSGLSLRQADLRRVKVQQVSFATSHFSNVVFKGAFDPVSGISLSPDGLTLASASISSQIFLWSATNLQLIDTLSAHESPVLAVAFSPDGQFLVSGDTEKVIFWSRGSTSSWMPQRALPLPSTMAQPEFQLKRLVFSPDRQLLAASPARGDVIVWNIQSGERSFQHSHPSDDSGVSTIAFNPTKQILANAQDEVGKLWDLHNGTSIMTLRGHTGQINCLAYSPDGEFLVSGSIDGTLRFWHSQEEEATVVFDGLKTYPVSIAFSPDGQWLAVSDAQFIRLWAIRKIDKDHVAVADTRSFTALGYNFQLRHVLAGHANNVASLIFSPDGHTLYSFCMQYIRQWDVVRGHPLHVLLGHQNSLYEVAISPDDQLLVTGDINGTVQLWQVSEDMVERTMVLGECASPVRAVACTMDGKHVLAYDVDETLYCWHIESTRLRLAWRDPEFSAIYPSISTDGQFLATICDDGRVRVRHTDSGTLRYVLSGYSERLNRIVLSNDGQLLAGLDGSNQIYVWDLGADEAEPGGTGSEQWLRTTLVDTVTAADGTAELHPAICFDNLQQQHIEAIKFGVDDTLIYGAAGSVYVVDLITRQQKFVATRDSAYMTDLEVSQTGIIASSGYGLVIWLHDARSGQLLGELHGHSDCIYDVTFNSKGTRLHSVSLDGELRVWDVASQTCLQIIPAEPAYAGVNITGATGLSRAQRESLHRLGAVDDFDPTPFIPFRST